MLLSVVVSSAVFAVDVDEFVESVSAQPLEQGMLTLGSALFCQNPDSVQLEAPDLITMVSASNQLHTACTNQKVRLHAWGKRILALYRTMYLKGVDTRGAHALHAKKTLITGDTLRCNDQCLMQIQGPPGVREVEKALLLDTLQSLPCLEGEPDLSYSEVKQLFTEQLRAWVAEVAYVTVQWNKKRPNWEHRVYYPLITDCPNPLKIDESAWFVKCVWPNDMWCPTNHDELQDCWKRSRKDFDDRKRILGRDNCAFYKQEKKKLFDQEWVTVHKPRAERVLQIVESKVYPWTGKETIKEAYLLAMLGYVVDVFYKEITLNQRDIDWFYTAHSDRRLSLIHISEPTRPY